MKKIHVLALLMAVAGCMICATMLNAQTLMGSSGAGFQTWTAANLNNNGAPFWDAPTNSVGDYSGNQDSKNVGFCLTSGGDCVGIGSALFAPGPIPFWGMPFDSSGDTGGAIDPKIYFRRDGTSTFRATLQLNLSTVSVEVNEFGWFETNATGTRLGPTHMLFQGGGVPPGTLTPSPIGATVTFRPTQYFGYYYSDVSEGGCLVYTISSFQTDCLTHNFAVFATNPGARNTTWWIGGEDPAGCGDGDCNLTLVKISPANNNN